MVNTTLFIDVDAGTDGVDATYEVILGTDEYDNSLTGSTADIVGSSSSEIIYGLDGIDNISGGGGNDFIDGGLEIDIINGGPGNDVIFGNQEDDTLTGGDGADQFIYDISTHNGMDEITDFNVADDMLVFQNYLDVPGFLPATVLLVRGFNVEIAFGGTYVIDLDSRFEIKLSGLAIANNTKINVGVDYDTDGIDDTFTLVLGTENDNGIGAGSPVNGTTGNDLIFGFSGNDAILASDGDDVILGGAGDDGIDGGGGNDLIAGGDGIDTARYIGGANLDPFSLDFAIDADGFVEVHHLDGSVDSLIHIEKVQFTSATYDLVMGSRNDDVVIDTTVDDIIVAGDGNDTLAAGGGDDILYGGRGNDVLQGGIGDDILFGGEGENMALYTAEIGKFEFTLIDASDPSSVEMTIDTTVVNQGTDTVKDIDILMFILDGVISRYDIFYGDDITSNNFNINDSIFNGNVIFGGDNNDILLGFSGDDYLTSQGGDDVLVGGVGDDTYFGASGIDTALYSISTSALELNASFVSTTSVIIDATASGEGTDTLNDVEKLAVGGKSYDLNLSTATDGNDTIVGGLSNENDLLLGFDGNDDFTGSGGNDAIIGGAGTDTLIYAGISVSKATFEFLGTFGLENTFSVNTGEGVNGFYIDSLKGIEKIHFSDDGLVPYTLAIGDDSNNTLSLPSSRGLLLGFGGNDNLSGTQITDEAFFGGAGDDILDGNLSFDNDIALYQGTIFEYDFSINLPNNEFIITDGNASRDGEDTITVSGGQSTIERLAFDQDEFTVTLGDNTNNYLTGTTTANELFLGFDGGDNLTDMNGTGGDVFYGGAGNDTIKIDSGGNYIDGGADYDVLEVSGHANIGFGIFGDFIAMFDRDTGHFNLIQSIEEIKVFYTDYRTNFGSAASADTLGDSLATFDQIVYGFGGGDEISGGAGNDILGADIYNVSHNDRVTYQSSNTQVRFSYVDGDVEGGDVRLFVDATSGGEGIDMIYGFEIIQLAGVDYGLVFASRNAPQAGAGNQIIINNHTDEAPPVFGDQMFAASGLTTGGDDIIIGGTNIMSNYIYGGSNDIYGDIHDNDGLDYFGGDDVIYGNIEEDSIFGDANNISSGILIAGDDVIFGEEAQDYIYGDVRTNNGTFLTAGADLIDGGFDHDEIYGDFYLNNVKVVTAGDDAINGGDGDDDIYGDGHSNRGIVTTAGNDTIFDFNHKNLLVGDIYWNVADTLDGLATPNSGILTSAGDDGITAGSGDDTIYGDVAQNGNELAVSGRIENLGNDVIDGGDGQNIIYGDLGTNGQGGVIVNTSFKGNDTITAGSGNDNIFGDFKINYGFINTTGNDTIYGGGNSDSVIGDGAHNHGTITRLGNDTLTGGDGIDAIYGDLVSNHGSVSFAGDDQLYGGDGNDLLYGDVYYGSVIGGNDIIDGGAGNDVSYYRSSINQISLNYASQQSEFVITTDLDGTDTLREIERLNLGGQEYSLMYGGAGDDGIFAGTSSINGSGSIMMGLGGDDIFFIDSQWNAMSEIVGDTGWDTLVINTLDANPSERDKHKIDFDFKYLGDSGATNTLRNDTTYNLITRDGSRNEQTLTDIDVLNIGEQGALELGDTVLLRNEGHLAAIDDNDDLIFIREVDLDP